MPCRVSVENRTNYTLISELGEITGVCSGKLQFTVESASELPKAGDWVMAAVFDIHSEAIIHEVLERKTKLSRQSPGKKTAEQVLASNIDLIFIVQPLDETFRVNRVERMVAAAYESGAQPVVILSKSDLSENVENKISLTKRTLIDVPVIALSSITGYNIEEVKSFLHPGETIVLLGQSGAGKSTLINALLGEERQKINDVRKGDNKGKHTTTKRELVILPNGSILIDTPGIRELQFWGGEDGLSSVFPEIEELTTHCKFSDCTHKVEKGCAVLAAIEKGTLDQEVYNHYMKMQKEIDYHERKKDENFVMIERKKWKAIHKSIKKMPKKRSF